MFMYFFATKDSAIRHFIKTGGIFLCLLLLLFPLCGCSTKMPWEVASTHANEQRSTDTQETGTVTTGWTGSGASEPELSSTEGGIPAEETNPYWTYEYTYELVNGEMVSDEPGRSFIPDEVREQTISNYQEGYRYLKAQAWETAESDPWLNGNIYVLISALEELPVEKRTPPTYAEMRVSVINRDIDKYYGDLLSWAGVTITGVTEYGGDSVEAQNINADKPFCIVTARTVHDEELILFVMDNSRIYEFYQAGIMNSIRGYPVGVIDNSLVLCVAGLYGG